MTFESLKEIIFNEMKYRIENKLGLSIFARERAKFEGWVKIELCEILSMHFVDIIPEGNYIDIIADNWAIQLKTVNTSYKDEKSKKKTKPITDNVQGVIDDISKLKSKNYANKAVFLLCFQLSMIRKNGRRFI